MRRVLLLMLLGTFCSGSSYSAQPTGPGDARLVRNLAAGSLICSVLSGDDLFAVPPSAQEPDRSDADAAKSIQFTQIWTDGHATTVTRDTTHDTRSVVATVKLPFALSAAQIARFSGAGWRPRQDRTTGRTSYCLDGPKPAQGEATAQRRGLLCVTGGS